MIEQQIAELERKVRRLMVRGDPQPIACRVYDDAAQTLADDALTVIAFAHERWDKHAMHDTSTNNGRIYVPVAGWYYVWADIGFIANATGYRAIYLRLDGSTYIAGQRSVTNSASIYSEVIVSTVYYLTAGQYVEVIARQNSGGDLNTYIAANRSSEFAVIKAG